MKTKNLEELNENDLWNLIDYTIKLYETLPVFGIWGIHEKDDFIWFKNRLRHINEILEKK